MAIMVEYNTVWQSILVRNISDICDIYLTI